jgi:hypothetical protein
MLGFNSRKAAGQQSSIQWINLMTDFRRESQRHIDSLLPSRLTPLIPTKTVPQGNNSTQRKTYF